eukprot:TRINITY_DN5430_c0_g2_i1.p1 TRINITY_DN5430_c0_g2~~TRINITY_DN5430_c0_g2_i1.p1  ORF type:complete len:434 (-),score=52.28 TRINITY_DN5430_c0_g2_i1:126-1427(-)
MVDTEKVAKMFIRPPRFNYRIEDLAYGLKVPGARRDDFQVFNLRNERIFGSIWDPAQPGRDAAIVIFCHGNAGSRMDGLRVANLLLPYGISVCGFDFSGCGHSQGEYITLGWKEKEDLAKIFEHVKRLNRYKSIIVWGRSMGGATTLFFASRCRDPMLKMIILEAPYASLESCALNQAKKVVGNLPEFLVKGYLAFVDETIQIMTQGLNPKDPKAGMSLYEMKTVDIADRILVPAYYGVGDQDDLTPPRDVKSIFDNHFGGPKYFRIYKGGHKFTEGIPQDWLNGAIQFIQMQLSRPPIEPIKTGAGAQRRATDASPISPGNIGNMTPGGRQQTNLNPPSLQKLPSTDQDLRKIATAPVQNITHNQAQPQKRPSAYETTPRTPNHQMAVTPTNQPLNDVQFTRRISTTEQQRDSPGTTLTYQPPTKKKEKETG